jgi:hypothetical protein
MILREKKTGNVLNLPDGAARQLLSDAPGCYEIVAKGPDVAEWLTSQAKAFDAPPHDKMLRSSVRKHK